MKAWCSLSLLLVAAPLLGATAVFAQNTTSGLLFVPVNPCRVADTRNADGPFGGPTFAGGASRDFVIPDSACGVPPTAAAYSLNVAVVPQGPLGYLTVWPTGQPRPLVATSNSVDGRVKSSAAIVPAGFGGAISVFASNATDIVLDIDGYFVPPSANPNALAFYPIIPCRVADTRNVPGPLGGPSLLGGQIRAFPILSSACNIPSTAEAYSLNFAAVPSGQLGYLTAWPAGQPQPFAATLNAATGAVTANAAMVPAGAGGEIDVFASNDTDLVIDVDGYFAPPGQLGALYFYELAPCRALDTRQPAGSQPFSGERDVNVPASACAAPPAQAYVFNATVVPPGSLGFLTLWPQGIPQPLAATLNAVDGAVTNNLAIVPTNNGFISAFVSNPTQLVLDIFGFFSSASSLADNPAPAITSLVPSSSMAGSLAQPLTIFGTSFMPGSVVSYSGIAHATTFVSANELATTLSAADLQTAGNFPVTVVNPAPGGGASNSVNFTVSVNPISTALTLRGQVEGGLTAITGSSVTLWAAGAAYGAGAAPLGTATTDGSGSFTIGFNCPAGNPTAYLTALGGDAGSGANRAIGMVAALGPCNALGSPAEQVTVNELTTVAAEWTLAQFTDLTGQIIGAPVSNAAGLGNATHQAVSDLVDSATGNPAAFLPTPAQCAGSPAPVNCDGLDQIDTVGNIIAACVNSSGPSSPQCSSLFASTDVPSTGTTLEAAHTMATNPTANVGALFALQTAAPAPFTPALVSGPADWTLALNFAPSGAQFDLVGLPALDAAGNVWVTILGGGAGCATQSSPCGSISELTAASAYTEGFNFAPAEAGFDSPVSAAVDSGGNIFAGNSRGGAGCATNAAPCGSVSELTASSGYSTGLNFAPSGAEFDFIGGVALDIFGDLWAVNEAGGSGCATMVFPCGSVSVLPAAGGYALGRNFAPAGATFNSAFSLALDGSNNVWVANFSFPGSVSELTASSKYGAGLDFSPAGALFNGVNSVALDGPGNVWATNSTGGSGCGQSSLLAVAPCGSVSVLTVASTYTHGFNFAPPAAKFDVPIDIALDPAGDVWVANQSDGSGCANTSSGSNPPCGSVSELTPAGGYTTGLNFDPPGAGFDRPAGIALDSAGNIWVTNQSGGVGCATSPTAAPCGSVSELIGLAKPVLTPAQACLKSGNNVCSP